jgi:pyrimidine operon attenuation protein/uracil phosphoribosyltransferase
MVPFTGRIVRAAMDTLIDLGRPRTIKLAEVDGVDSVVIKKIEE